MNDLDELIKRARGLAAHSYGGVSRTLRELTDALEAATRVPVQGEPNDDREALARLVQRFEECDNPDYLLADFLLSQGVGFSRATVPDAETERYKDAAEGNRIRLVHAQDDVVRLEAERDAALAAVERVRAIHKPVEIEPSDTICGECSFQLPNGTYFGKVVEFPCDTLAALGLSAEQEVTA